MMIPSLDEGRSQRARRKAAASASHRRNRREALKGRGCETLLRHEGLAPVRLSIRLETGSGSFAGEFLPDIGSIVLPYPRGSWSPDLRAGDPWTPGFPFRALAARGRQVGQRRARASAIMKRRQPLPLSKRQGRTRNETKETTPKPMRTGGAHAAPWPRLRREGAQEIKKALGVGVSP